MAEKSTYWQLLRRPEWQEKRLRIMERAKFQCEECSDNETTLNVHHKYYTKGAKPWEYPNEALVCLCENCHTEFHINDDLFKQNMALLGTVGASKVRGFAKALLLINRDDPQSTLQTADPYELDGVLTAYGISGSGHNWYYLMRRTIKGHISHETLVEMHNLDAAEKLFQIAADEYEAEHAKE